MRIIIFAQYFPPELGACANRMELFARGLASKGHYVTVVCGMPNYPKGKTYDGYRFKIFKREKYGDVDVLRVWVFPSRRKRLLGRLVNYLSYFFSASFFALFLKKRDIVLVSIPPLFVGFAGLFFAIVKGGRLVVDVRDVSEEILYSNYSLRKLLQFFGMRAERFLLRISKRITTVTEGTVNYLRKFFPNENKIFLIENSIDFDMVRDSMVKVGKDELGWDGKFVILYAGNIGYLSNLRLLVDIAKLAQQRGENDLLFVIVGDGVEKDSLRQYADGLNNIIFVEPMERRKLLGYIYAADLFFVSLPDLPLMDFVLPAKILEPIALKKPVVAAFPDECIKRISSIFPIISLPINDLNSSLNTIIQIKSSPDKFAEIQEQAFHILKERFDANRKIDYLNNIMLNLQKL